MRISSVFSGRFALVSALALLAGCASVILLNPNEDGSGGAGGGGGGSAVDAGMDVEPPDADKCSTVNLSNGIVAHYPFDGDTSDTSGNALHGIPSGNTSFVDGRIGKAIFLEGWQTMVTVPLAPPLDLFEEFSLTAWVNPAFYPDKQGANPVIIAQLFSTDIAGNFVLQVQVGASELADAFSVAYRDYPDGGDAGVAVKDIIFVTDDPVAPKRIPIGVWTQVTATFNHGVLQLFLNGKLVAQKDTDVIHTEMMPYPHKDVIIGNVWGGNYAWHGALDDVRIYGRALSADEVACLAAM